MGEYFTQFVQKYTEEPSFTSIKFPSEETYILDPPTIGFYSISLIMLALSALAFFGSKIIQNSDQRENIERKKWMKMLLCFDPVKNSESFISISDKRDSNLDVFELVKIIGVVLIVYCHCGNYTMYFGVQNPEEYQEILQGLGAIFYKSGYVCVHVLFYLGAFLATFLMIKGCIQYRSVPIVKAMVLRILRIVPTYFFLTLAIFPNAYSATGPYSNRAKYQAYGCKETWWPNVFLVNSFLPWGTAPI